MKIVVVLDNVRSVHNVGSIFRTADAAGIEKIYCCGITPGPFDRFKNVRADFAKVALGAESSVAWEVIKDASGVSDTLVIIERLKKDGWQIFAIEQAENSIPYYEAHDIIEHTASRSDSENCACSWCRSRRRFARQLSHSPTKSSKFPCVAKKNR